MIVQQDLQTVTVICPMAAKPLEAALAPLENKQIAMMAPMVPRGLGSAKEGKRPAIPQEQATGHVMDKCCPQPKPVLKVQQPMKTAMVRSTKLEVTQAALAPLVANKAATRGL